MAKTTGSTQEKQQAKAVTLPALVNPDGSYSVSMRAEDLALLSFVDYYDDTTGEGYQRFESGTDRRATEIAEYIKTAKNKDVPYYLRDLEANARLGKGEAHFDADPGHPSLGMLTLPVKPEPYIAIIDGGTRFLGVSKAMELALITGDERVSLRLHVNESVVLEAVLFETINGKQKLVRSDLATRQLQVMADKEGLTDHDMALIHTLLPDQETWQLQATRLAGKLVRSEASPWFGKIQMPGITGRNEAGAIMLPETKPIKLASFITAMKPLMEGDQGPAAMIRRKMADGILPSNALEGLVNNAWTAIAEVNEAYAVEPRTGVLWGSIGATAVHIAYAKLVERILRTEEEPKLKPDRLTALFDKTAIADYEFWYSRKGDRDKDSFTYPATGFKGEATKLVGSANIAALGNRLWEQMLAALEGRAETSQQAQPERIASSVL